MASAAATRTAASALGSLEARTGSPAARAAAMARALLPASSRIGAALGEIGVLGQEPVPRVDRVGARDAGGREDLPDRQVRPDRVTPLADLEALVGLEPVQRVAVLPREDRDGLGAEFDRRPERAHRDLAAVSDQDLREHGTP
jgi:hypothetical protein